MDRSSHRKPDKTKEKDQMDSLEYNKQEYVAHCNAQQSVSVFCQDGQPADSTNQPDTISERTVP